MTFPKLGVAGSNPVRRSERSPGSARLRSRGFFLMVHRQEVMHWLMQTRGDHGER